MYKDIQGIFSGDLKLKNIPEDCVAIIGAAIRTERWMDTFNFLKDTNKTPFIMIFCGHVRPDYETPDNFFYVHSNLNAVACNDIALRLAHEIPQVKYVMNIADDCLWPNKVLDTIVAEHEADPKEDVMIAPGFWGDVNANEAGELTNTYHVHDPDSPTLVVAGMAKKTTSIKIGPSDRRFKGQYWDCDRSMRLHEIGGDVRTISDLAVREIEPWNGSHILGPSCYNHDRPLLDWLWTTNRRGGPVSLKRLDKVHAYKISELKGEILLNEE